MHLTAIVLLLAATSILPGQQLTAILLDAKLTPSDTLDVAARISLLRQPDPRRAHQTLSLVVGRAPKQFWAARVNIKSGKVLEARIKLLFYGKTKQRQDMTENKAVQKGYHPAIRSGK